MARLVVTGESTARAIDAAARALALVGGGHRLILLRVERPSLVAAPHSDSGAAVTSRLEIGNDTGPEEVLASANRLEADAQSEIEEALRQAHLDARVRVRVETGEPGETICRVADIERADLIVMGRSHRGRARRLLKGSVNDYVTEHANCPVLVVAEPAS